MWEKLGWCLCLISQLIYVNQGLDDADEDNDINEKSPSAWRRNISISSNIIHPFVLEEST